MKVQNILDSADGEYAHLAADLDTQKKIACDLSRSTEERLEAFEDVIDTVQVYFKPSKSGRYGQY